MDSLCAALVRMGRNISFCFHSVICLLRSVLSCLCSEASDLFLSKICAQRDVICIVFPEDRNRCLLSVFCAEINHGSVLRMVES
jgi:hypothetical protein